MVLAANEVLVVGDADRQADLVAGGAELGVFQNRFEKRLLVHLGLGLHERVVDPLQERVVAEREGVMLWLFDRVGGVASGVVDVGDRVAGRAGDSGLAGGVVHVVIIGIVEFSREERHGIVAAGAPSGCLGRCRSAASETRRVSRTLAR